MKKLLFIALIIGCFADCSAYDILKFVKNLDEVKSIPLNGRCEFYFHDYEIYVVPDDGDAFYMEYNNFSRMEFTKSLDAIVDIPQTEDGDISIIYLTENNQLKVASKDNILNVAIYNMLGMPVYQSSPNQQELTIEIGEYLSGIYIVSVMSEREQKSCKIVKK